MLEAATIMITRFIRFLLKPEFASGTWGFSFLACVYYAG